MIGYFLLGIAVGCIAMALVIYALEAIITAAPRRAINERNRRRDAETQAFILGKYDRGRATLRLAQHYGATMKRPEDFTDIDGTGA